MSQDPVNPGTFDHIAPRKAGRPKSRKPIPLYLKQRPYVSTTARTRAFLRGREKGLWPLPEQAAWRPGVQFPGTGPQVLQLVVPKQHLGKGTGQVCDREVSTGWGWTHWASTWTSASLYRSKPTKGWGQAWGL